MNKNQYFECDWRECIASYKFQMRKRWLAEQEQREARLNIYLEALTNELSREIFIFIAFYRQKKITSKKKEQNGKTNRQYKQYKRFKKIKL